MLGDIVTASAAALRPSALANWCVETARLANAFYRDLPVLDAEEPTRSARLRLVSSVHKALSLGLGLLGIPTPEEM